MITTRLPRVIASATITTPGQADIIIETQEFPVTAQDQFSALAGDGKARVAVTVDMGIKDYGSGVSTSCTVSLTCNQDQQTLTQAAYLAEGFAKWFAKECHTRAEADFLALRDERRMRGLG